MLERFENLLTSQGFQLQYIGYPNTVFQHRDWNPVDVREFTPPYIPSWADGKGIDSNVILIRTTMDDLSKAIAITMAFVEKKEGFRGVHSYIVARRILNEMITIATDEERKPYQYSIQSIFSFLELGEKRLEGLVTMASKIDDVTVTEILVDVASRL